MPEFRSMKAQMQKSFEALTKNKTALYVTDVNRDVLWETYLNSFTDPEERQGHNCNCCRSFIKQFGNIVAIEGDKIVSMWNFETNETFQAAVKALDTYVCSANIKSQYISDLEKLGTDTSKQELADGTKLAWDHFHIKLDKKFVNKSSASRESLIGTKRDERNVFKRALDEFSIDTVETILELIAQDSIYKGVEYKGLLNAFLAIKRKYDVSANKELFAWGIASENNGAVLKIRNTSIGTLLIDISEGKELDKAIDAFERKVAGPNYKRPKPVVTAKQIEELENLLESRGLLVSLGRRHATVDDIPVNNLIFVNKDSKKATGIFDSMKEDLPVNPKTFSKTEEVHIDKFITDILPSVTSLEVLVENSHLNNLVSLITAKNAEAPSMFKWNNQFSWSYVDEMADSIKEQVKAAGGRIEGELRISLSWHNYDDLDLHVYNPDGGHINFSNKRSSGGVLDVDMNAGGGTTKSPVENVIYANRSSTQEGTYKVTINNFSLRDHDNTGGTLQIECQGEIYDIPFGSIRHKDTLHIVEFNYSRAGGIKFKTDVKSATSSRERWGISTNKFHKAKMITLSPNFWEGKEIGNKHFMFILDGVKNDESARGFYNEFLPDDFNTLRRGFEVLGSRTKVEYSDEQLGGLGFSSTQRNHIICRVEGKFKRIIKINF